MFSPWLSSVKIVNPTKITKICGKLEVVERMVLSVSA